MMTNHQKSDFVSVIITTYNRADYIEQTLNSIQNQTYSNLEILVIDDGSNDEIATKVKSICSQFSKCKYYWKPNSGQPDSRNYGINLAKGNFIGFCDDDDYWVLNKLELQLEILNTNQDFDIVTGCIAYVDNFGASLDTTKCHIGYNHGYIFKELLSKNRTDAVTPLLRRNVFDKTGYFNPKFTISEDWDFWRRASYYHKFYATNQILAYVRKHEFNMTNTAYPTVIESILMYYKVTYYLLKWGKNKFSTAEKEIIETAAYSEYQRLISNHFHSNVAKLKCVLLLIIKNPEAAVKIVLSLLKKTMKDDLNNKKTIKVAMVYEEYPHNYPPFKLFLDYFTINSKCNVAVTIFKKTNTVPKYCFVMPHSYLRSIYQKLMFFNPLLNKLKYPEQYWLNKKLDIIHIQNSFLFHHVLRLAQLPKSSRPKILISMVGGETYVKPWFEKKWTDFYSNQGHLIDAYTVQSKHQKTYLSRWGINPDRIHVVPVSFGEKSNAKPKYPNDDIIKIVSAFRMTWEKNIEGNLRFAKILNENNIPFRYDIYGDGNDLGQLYYLVDAYKLNDKVFIHRKIENDILKQKLREYDFYLQLSISEALSASVIEAQSLGLPCIVSNSDGISEAIVPNQTGISGTYLDLDNLVEQTLSLWNNQERYFQHSLAAIKFANENYTVENETNRILNLYNFLIQPN